MIKVDLSRGTILFDGEEIGHVKWGIVGQTAEIKDIWIARPYQRQGVGTQVVKILESEFRKHGCRRVELFRVQPKMGFPFAKSMGYRAVGGFGIYKHMAKDL